MTITYIIGTVINLTAIGNKKRMVLVTDKTNGLFVTAKNAFVLSNAFIQRHFSLVTLAFILIICILTWYMITQEEVLKNVDFKFPLPGLITFISYCLLSALYAPSSYLDSSTEITIAYINGNLGVRRVANCVYFAFILLLVLNIFYYCAWLYKKNFKYHNSILGTSIVCISVVMTILSIKSQIIETPGKYLTSASISDLSLSTAQYYGYQMALNFQILETDDAVVTVSPIAVDPFVLYPRDASDWKEGVRTYYGKDEVNYDHEPYF